MEFQVAKTRYKKRVRGKVKEIERSHNNYTVRMNQFRVTPETAKKIESAIKQRGVTYSELLRQVCEASFSE